MPTINNKNLSRHELFKYSGNISNFCGIDKLIADEGKAGGLKLYKFKTGAGLEFTITPDKCLDIANLSYKGINISQMAKNGITSPEYGVSTPGEFPYFISGGMLFTVGLMNCGPDSFDGDDFYITHGRLAVTPAENAYARTYWESDEYYLEAGGIMRESKLFGHNLLFERKIKTKMGSNIINITDILENIDSEPYEFVILYHFNFGFPFLDEDLKLNFGENKCVSRTVEAELGMPENDIISKPVDNFFEHVFFRSMTPDENGYCTVNAENKKLGIAAYIKYEQKNLPNLVQWKSMRSGDYALGIEPANNFVCSRKLERENGTLKTINPGEKLIFNLELGLSDVK